MIGSTQLEIYAQSEENKKLSHNITCSNLLLLLMHLKMWVILTCLQITFCTFHKNEYYHAAVRVLIFHQWLASVCHLSYFICFYAMHLLYQVACICVFQVKMMMKFQAVLLLLCVSHTFAGKINSCFDFLIQNTARILKWESSIDNPVKEIIKVCREIVWS